MACRRRWSPSGRYRQQPARSLEIPYHKGRRTTNRPRTWSCSWRHAPRAANDITTDRQPEFADPTAPTMSRHSFRSRSILGTQPLAVVSPGSGPDLRLLRRPARDPRRHEERDAGHRKSESRTAASTWLQGSNRAHRSSACAGQPQATDSGPTIRRHGHLDRAVARLESASEGLGSLLRLWRKIRSRRR